MILQIFLTILISAINILFFWLPSVTSLPFGLDNILVMASGYFHGAMDTLPYLEVVWTCFLYLLGFELLLVILKFFLGSRAPGHNAN